MKLDNELSKGQLEEVRNLIRQSIDYEIKPSLIRIEEKLKENETKQEKRELMVAKELNELNKSVMKLEVKNGLFAIFFGAIGSFFGAYGKKVIFQ